MVVYVATRRQRMKPEGIRDEIPKNPFPHRDGTAKDLLPYRDRTAKAQISQCPAPSS